MQHIEFAITTVALVAVVAVAVSVFVVASSVVFFSL